MTEVAEGGRGVDVDPILLEVLRSRLQSVADEAAVAIERTAVSPIVAEGKDYSSNVLDARGGLLVGGGKVEYKWGGARNVVQATLARHGGSVAPGDVFAANDPHDGGGNHPQDIEICRPVFIGDELIAWIAASAHLVDVGGMTFGSWAPHANECFQEAVRFPPVRLFARDVECPDTWAMFLANVRLPQLVEMDVRGLVAGCHVAAKKLEAVVESLGVDAFVDTAAALNDVTETVLRDRISRIAEGTYAMCGWVEWGDERYDLPCVLEVEGDELHFDFSGAPPQVPHFVNSKAYIVEGQVVADVRSTMAQDLPFCEGLYRPVRVTCPPGTIVDSRPPAPIASAHLDVAMNATALAVQCLQLALAATPSAAGVPVRFAGPSGQAALANHSWSYTTDDGRIDGWVLSEAFQPGSSGGIGFDGSDLFANLVGAQHVLDFVDIEITEAWYPLLVREKSAAPGTHGAGRHRSGSGCRMAYGVSGGEHLRGAMFAMRETLPIAGVAGGAPGAATEFRIERADGTVEVLEAHAADVGLAPGDVFVFHAGSGGGWGDPLDRSPADVRRDLRIGRYGPDEAAEVYGVLLSGDGQVDVPATDRRREEIRRDRLARAKAPAKPAMAAATTSTPPGPELPLYHGVVQRGSLAIGAESGALLAVAPDQWPEGCPTLEELRHSSSGRTWLERTYLDPASGRALAVEAVPPAAPRSFASAPRHWTDTALGPTP